MEHVNITATPATLRECGRSKTTKEVPWRYFQCGFSDKHTLKIENTVLAESRVYQPGYLNVPLAPAPALALEPDLGLVTPNPGPSPTSSSQVTDLRVRVQSHTGN